MDTDDLSIPTYNGFIIEAEKFNYDLTLQFGVLASYCKNDDDYLSNAESIINEWLEEEDMFYLIEDIFYGEEVDETAFKITLQKILTNIAEIRKTPMEKREFEDWG